jgi:heat shock protein HslJ
MTTLRATILGCALVTAACATSSTSPTIGTISMAGLSGTWRLQLLQPAGQGAQLTPANATYTLTLSNGSASVHADCNSCVGTFTLVGDALTLASGLACTRAACPTQAFEALYTKILDGASTVGISGSTMTLVSTRGVLRLTR